MNFPLLSDYPDPKTIKAYGVFDVSNRLAERSYFIVDKQGIIRFKAVMASDRDLMKNDELLTAIAKINHRN